jgi:hypothetical protein
MALEYVFPRRAKGCRLDLESCIPLMNVLWEEATETLEGNLDVL